MYRYIGNKAKLTPYILDKVHQMIGDAGTVADIMAGTGTVSLELRKKGYKVVASDVMTYSYHHLNVNLCMKEAPEFIGLKDVITDDLGCMYLTVLKYLNQLEPKKSFFYQEFSPDGTPRNGTPPRKYFTSDNAMRIDAMREKINEWIDAGNISKSEESLLKHTLIMAVNEVANISGTYGYFLSSFKKNSLEKIELKPIDFYESNSEGHVVKLGFAENLAATIKADLCYIDPPYMKRQYDALRTKEQAKSITEAEKERLDAIRDAMKQNRKFPEKVIKYLWDDAFKFNREVVFETSQFQSLEQVIRTFMYAEKMDRFAMFKENVRAAFTNPEE